MDPEQEQVKLTLEPYQLILSQLPVLAIDTWNKNPDKNRLNHPRIRANIVWGYIISFAREFLVDNPNISFIPHHSTVSLKVAGCNHEVMIRYKKANKKNISCNVKTYLSDSYHDHHQRQLFLFPGMSDPDRIEIVYILNELATSVEDIRVVARNKKNVIWSYSIKQTGDVVNISTKQPNFNKENNEISYEEKAVKLNKDKFPNKIQTEEGG